MIFFEGIYYKTYERGLLGKHNLTKIRHISGSYSRLPKNTIVVKNYSRNNTILKIGK